MTILFGTFFATIEDLSSSLIPRGYAFSIYYDGSTRSIRQSHVCRALTQMIQNYEDESSSINDDDTPPPALCSEIESSIAETLQVGQTYQNQLVIGVIYIDGIDESCFLKDSDYGIIAHPRNESHLDVILPHIDMFTAIPFSYYYDSYEEELIAAIS